MTERDLGEFHFPTAETRAEYRGAIDPLDGRYKDPEIAKYFGEEARVACQAYVEATLAHTYADDGKCTREAAIEIEMAGREVSVVEVEARENGTGEFDGRATKHDVMALVEAISDRVSDEAKPIVHAAATSYDIISTANAFQYREGMNNVVLPRIVTLGDVIAELTDRYAAEAQVGRTHGQHGVPITFGFTLSRYLGRLGESAAKIKEHADGLQGKFSGAVGGYNASSLINIDPKEFERAFLAKLGLTPCEHATQIVPAENTLRLLAELANASGIMAQIGEDMRNLQRTEIGEVGEKFDPKSQKGSSAMVQKQNPITFENAAGMHREVLAQLFNAYQNLVSDHQRDLRDSPSMRFYGIIPAIVAHTATNLTKTMSKLQVNGENMHRNLYFTEGMIAAEALQVVLRDRGYVNAYNIAKGIVNTARAEGRTFREVVATDEVTAEVLAEVPDYQRQAILSPETDNLGLTEKEARRQVTNWRETTSRIAA